MLRVGRGGGASRAPAPRYCLIQCQAGGHDEMCTLIYWAKLVPLRHINIDEGGEEALEVSLKTSVLELGCF